MERTDGALLKIKGRILLFGYIEPEKGELRLWEYEQYRALYCGLCRSMGIHTGQLSRFTLNYEYTFLAMIRTALTDVKPEFVPRRCPVHPLHKRASAADDSALEYCANVSAMLTYYKVLDNIADSRGAKKLLFSAAEPICSSVFSRAAKLGGLGGKVAEKLDAMSKLEKSDCGTPDSLAELFGEIMSDIFSYAIDDSARCRIAAEIGRHTGRYIYLADTLDDVEEDIRLENFNPFVKMYTEEGLKEHTDQIKTAVLLELRGLETAVNLVDFSLCPGYGNIVRNIIYLGMPGKIGKILKKAPYIQNQDSKERCEK